MCWYRVMGAGGATTSDAYKSPIEAWDAARNVALREGYDYLVESHFKAGSARLVQFPTRAAARAADISDYPDYAGECGDFPACRLMTDDCYAPEQVEERERRSSERY